MAKKQKKKNKKLHWVVLLLALVMLCGCAALGYFVFEIKEIKVEGSQRFSQEEVIAQSGVQLGQNLFLVSKSQVKTNIELQPYLHFERISYELPGTIVLHVSEKTAYGAVYYDGQYAFIDENGVVLQLSDQPNGVPLIEGFAPTAASLGAQIQGPTAYQLYAYGQIMPRLMAQSYADKIVEMDITQPAAVHIKTDTGMTIRMGSADNLDTKINWLNTLMPRLIQEGKLTGTLDVTGEKGASYIP